MKSAFRHDNGSRTFHIHKTASRLLENVFRQARKYKVGMFVAHHSLGDLPAETQNAIETNTSIKFVRAPNHDDAVRMAKEMGMGTTPEFIVDQGIGRFAVFLRDGKMKTALSVAMPIGAMEAAPKLTKEEYEAMRQRNRERYTVPATQQPPLAEAVVDESVATITPTVAHNNPAEQAGSKRQITPPSVPQYTQRPKEAAEALMAKKPPAPDETPKPRKKGDIDW